MIRIPNYGVRRIARMIRRMEEGRDQRALQLDLLRCLKNAMWFEHACFTLRARTAAELGRKICPECYGKETAHEDARKDKRIERYASGISSVSKRYLIAASRLGADCPAPYTMLLKALDVSKPMRGDRADELLSQLCLPIRKAIFRPLKGGGLIRRKTNSAINALRRYACAESVGALTILLREASEQGHGAMALQLGHALYDMTLIWCTRVPVRAARLEIQLYFWKYIFPLARTDRLAMTVEYGNYLDCVECLQCYLFQWNFFPREMRMKVADDLWDGWAELWAEWAGFTCAFGLAPGLSLVDSRTATQVESHEVVRRLVLKTWAWRALRRMEAVDVPPDSVIELLKKDVFSLTQADLDNLETEEEIGGYSAFYRWMRSPLKEPS